VVVVVLVIYKIKMQKKKHGEETEKEVKYDHEFYDLGGPIYCDNLSPGGLALKGPGGNWQRWGEPGIQVGTRGN